MLAGEQSQSTTLLTVTLSGICVSVLCSGENTNSLRLHGLLELLCIRGLQLCYIAWQCIPCSTSANYTRHDHIPGLQPISTIIAAADHLSYFHQMAVMG